MVWGVEMVTASRNLAVETDAQLRSLASRAPVGHWLPLCHVV